MLLHKIKDSLFEDFNGDTQGSGFSIDKSSCNLTVLRSVFVNCRTSTFDGGGGFYASIQAVDVSYCSFNRCFAPDQGSAFLISFVCQDFFLECSTIVNEEGFNEDGFFKYGSNTDDFCHSNISHLSGGQYILTNAPESKITSYYRFVNVQNIKATGVGLFYSNSKLTIESSNIVNCTSPYFLCFVAPALSLFSVDKSVISDCTFKVLTFNNEPTIQNTFNTYGSPELRDLFCEVSGEVVDDPSFLDVFFRCPEVYQNASRKPDQTHEIAVILMLVVEACPKKLPCLSLVNLH